MLNRRTSSSLFKYCSFCPTGIPWGFFFLLSGLIRYEWGKIFTRTIIEVMSNKDVESYTKFFMLTKCVLWNPKGKNKDSLDNIVKKRILRWRNGEHKQLWLEALSALTTNNRGNAFEYDR